MTPSEILLSTAYFPPVQYIALVARADRVLIENHENYIKQTYRNRCLILSANGTLSLTVPVLEGSFHKTHIRDIRIDYSKRWQQVHLGAISSSYRASPYYEFYFDRIQSLILNSDKYLIDLNMKLLTLICELTGLRKEISFTTEFYPVGSLEKDFRYSIRPKKSFRHEEASISAYHQVFSDRSGFVPGLSIIDLIFNTGPDALSYLAGSEVKAQ